LLLRTLLVILDQELMQDVAGCEADPIELIKLNRKVGKLVPGESAHDA
jgi:hypothetical protein